jgi:hypothetical protein
MKTSPFSSLQVSIGLGLSLLALVLRSADCFINQHQVTIRIPQKPRLTIAVRNRWTAGDVEGDFERLESAIKLENAEDDLLAKTRLDMMDFLASSRKEVSEKILTIMKGPLLISLFLTLTFRGISGSRALAVMNLLSALQFSGCIVVAPIVLLTIQSRKKRYYKTFTLPRELQGVGEHYLRFLTFYENPKLSCKDSVLCLLELWSFAVLPSLLYGPLSLTRRLLTRLAAAASLRQYPAQAYELWHQQMYPLTGMVVALRTFAKLMLSTPMFIIDSSLLMAKLEPKMILRWYAITLLFGTITCFGFKHIKPQNKVWSMASEFPAPLRLVSAFLALGSILKYHQSLSDVLTRHMLPFDTGAFSKLRFIAILRTILAILSCTGAVWNLASMQNNLRLAFTHNISLSTCLDDDCSTRINAFEDKESFAWRYWYPWRQPERISQSLRAIGSRFWRWLLLEGSVEEQISKARRNRPLPIFERLKFDDRTQWKTRAMNNVAEYHKRSMEGGTASVSSVWVFSLPHRIPGS